MCLIPDSAKRTFLLSVTFLSGQFLKLRAPGTIIRYEVICVIGESTSLSWDRLEQTSFKITRTVRTRLVPNYKLTFDPFRIVTLNSLGRKTREQGYNKRLL